MVCQNSLKLTTIYIKNEIYSHKFIKYTWLDFKTYCYSRFAIKIIWSTLNNSDCFEKRKIDTIQTGFF